MIQKTAADRAFIINLAQGEKPEITAALGFDEEQYDSVTTKFIELLKDRVTADAPLLMLDCSNDADFADLIPLEKGAIGSLIVNHSHFFLKNS